MTGKVVLVGAGPGDPELLTVRAARIIAGAEVILHDDLVSPEILALAPARARVESVGKRHRCKTVTQDAINAAMIRYATCGLTVVRLKGGDPLVFGRAGEEVDALRAAGIPVEIVPGITAVSAAAASAQLPLTDRRRVSSLVVLTGHRCAEGAPPDWRALVRLNATIAIYMPGTRYDDFAEGLTSAGLDAETPCLIVSRATRPNQVTRSVTVRELATTTPPPSPSLLIITPRAQVAASPAR